MSSEPTLLELAETIQKRSKQIHHFLIVSKLPQPSLSAKGASPDFLPRDNIEILDARAELRDAADQLNQLVAGTNQRLLDHFTLGQNVCNLLRIIYRFDVAKHVPLDRPISYLQLSKATGLNEDKLTRTMRTAIIHLHLFTELQQGYVEHSATSKALVTDPNAWDALGHFSDEIFRSSMAVADAIEKWPGSRLPTQSGFNVAFDTPKTFFEYLETEAPANIPRFSNTMSFGAALDDQFVTGFDWAALGNATVVDVGGGNGHKTMMILRANPRLKAVVQDLPTMIAMKATPVDGALQDRITFQAHDFFTLQPQKDAAVYFLARIFHDWPDEKCFEILLNLVPAMKPGARLVINDEVVLPPTNIVPTLEQRRATMTDMIMMAVANARERTLDDWKVLVEKGSDGLLKFEKAKGMLIVFIKS